MKTYVLTDETQDCDGCHARLIRLIAKYRMMVCDQLQFLYGWRGVDPLEQDELLFDGATTLLLGDNYRSTKPINDVSQESRRARPPPQGGASSPRRCGSRATRPGRGGRASLG